MIGRVKIQSLPVKIGETSFPFLLLCFNLLSQWLIDPFTLLSYGTTGHLYLSYKKKYVDMCHSTVQEGFVSLCSLFEYYHFGMNADILLPMYTTISSCKQTVSASNFKQNFDVSFKHK